MYGRFSSLISSTNNSCKTGKRSLSHLLLDSTSISDKSQVVSLTLMEHSHTQVVSHSHQQVALLGH